MPRCLVGLFTILILTGCNSSSDRSAEKANSNEPFYPFPQYLASQIAYVDSTPLAIEKITRINGKTVDSMLIDKSAFKQEIAPFTAIDPNEKVLKPKYTETSFQDLSIESLTFTITSTDPSLELQQADVLLKPETKQVKNVILQRYFSRGDSTVVQHILWVNNMKCQVAETITPKSGTAYNRTTLYIWDKPMQ